MKRPRKPSRSDAAASLPTREDVLRFIQDNPDRSAKRDIARAFNVTGEGRIHLKKLLRELEQDGTIERSGKRRFTDPDSLPAVAVLVVRTRDADGDLWAEPANWEGSGPPPRLWIAPPAKGDRRPVSLAPGDRVLARTSKDAAGDYTASPIRKLPPSGEGSRLVGLFQTGEDDLCFIIPATKKDRDWLIVDRSQTGGAKPGDLVIGETLRGKVLGSPRARVVEVIGQQGAAKAASMIAIAERDIPHVFPDAAVQQAEAAQPVPLGTRTDFRAVPLVTIDGEDARDFDDAVFAEPDPDQDKNPDGWHILVAIADVAHYVRPGDALDRSAFDRGNSVYFADRVVPMLPEALSNGLCSLRPGEDRGCLVAEMWIDKSGSLLRQKFHRGLMRSAARLTYTQVQNARDGQPDDTTGPLMDAVITPLYGAYAVLNAAREKRGALDLDLPERRAILEDGAIKAIVLRERFDAHKLIEEFMITANVAAARALGGSTWPCMFRVHEPPDPERVDALRETLKGMELSLSAGAAKPGQFNGLLRQVRGSVVEQLISNMVLRAQSQAVYQPENLGHFGLGLRAYAHFTSPIRRYADLLVHRALITALDLGDGGIDTGPQPDFDEVGEHISATERRAAAAERDTMDRYVAGYLSDRVGAAFAGRINGVGKAGLFVTLEETGADGLVPMRRLPSDYYDLDDRRHTLAGRHSGEVFRMGDVVQVRLVEATPVSGGMLFDLVDHTPALPVKQRPRKGSARGPHRGPNRGKPASAKRGKAAHKKGAKGRKRR